ncbi:hypothetical protein V1L54_02255 [Streptomyces sp. TRM 70361]|uniref:hypothetical protein n=1 Tax=Streptomyces sp. TRM 70361 TaxID=3116553 RepID=UPI002E7B9C6E|nr:hypothetical protein [Streptomyces sp. TRM 70361]MEE1938251.1 hypothetical protein [Streptomyces sp. TRM 70361]
MSVYQVSCPARVNYLDSEIDELQDVPDGGFQVARSLWCLLEAGHTGLHHTFTQGLRATDELPARNLWTRWPDGDEYGPQRETLILPPCTEKFLAGAIEEESCGLPAGHVGRHGFEFGPPLTEADVLPEWLFRMFFD